MFVVKKEIFGPFQKYILSHPDSVAYAAIIPDYGGNVIELGLPKEKKIYSVLDGNSTYHELLEDEAYKGAHLIPFSSRIENGIYTFQGKTYQLPLNKPDEGHALHGFLNNQPFEVVNVTEHKDFAALELSYSYNGSVPGYPFVFRLRMLYTLSVEGFKLETMVTNSGQEDMPYSYGWHPYFTFGNSVDELHLQLPASKSIVFNERLIPTGELITDERFVKPALIGNTELDNGFLIETDGIAEALLYSKENDLSIHLWLETGARKFRYLQVYIPPHRKSIAIEPVTSQTNAFNNGKDLIILKPGEVFSAACGVYLD